LILSPIAACSPESGAGTAILIVPFCANAGVEKFKAMANARNPATFAVNDIFASPV
jgi:hypothetical protein